jgi:hypothetical protein
MKRFASLVLAFSVFAASPTIASGLTPHRAFYSLALGDRSSTGDVVNVQGMMTYEWGDSCDGWTSSQKLRIKYFYEDGRSIDLGWSLSSWESKDGMRYRFFARYFDGPNVTSEMKGEARLDGVGKGGVAEFSEPKNLRLVLPSGTLFPTAHSISLLKHFAAGDRQLYATVFDGTDDQAPLDVSAVLAGSKLPAAETAKLSPLLANGPVYRVGLAFYAAGEEQSRPAHEQQLQVYGNGIVDRLTLDFGSFSVDAALKKLEPLAPPGC